jgi:hypothetical protein
MFVAVLFCLIVPRAHAARWLVPAGAHATGAQDTNWRTDLLVSNPSDEAATVTVYLLEARQDNSSLGRSSTHSVPANGQIVIGDVFETDFSFSGNGGLLVESSNGQQVVTSRTYNLLGEGNALGLPEGATFGQYIPGVKVDDALGTDVEGHIVYLAKSDAFRSNLGFCAATASGGRATVTMFAEDGTETGSVARDFNGFEQYQWNDIFSRTGSPDSTAARAVIVADAPIVAYGSVVDERTGDPVAVMADTLENAAFTASSIAAAARADGAEGSLWRTDIRIFNPDDSSATVTMDYRRKGRSGSPQASTTVTVGAGAVLALDDAMMEGFGLEEANGGINISSDVAVAVWSRTYNQSDTGTFGQSIPAEAAGSPLMTEQTRVYNGLSNTGSRSNVGFFNLESEQITLSLTLLNAAGDAGKLEFYTLEPNEMDQINDVFDWAGLTDPDDGVYTLLIDGDGDVLTFVSVIDNLLPDHRNRHGNGVRLRWDHRGHLCVDHDDLVRRAHRSHAHPAPPNQPDVGRDHGLQHRHRTGRLRGLGTLGIDEGLRTGYRGENRHLRSAVAARPSHTRVRGPGVELGLADPDDADRRVRDHHRELYLGGRGPRDRRALPRGEPHVHRGTLARLPHEWRRRRHEHRALVRRRDRCPAAPVGCGHRRIHSPAGTELHRFRKEMTTTRSKPSSR